MALTLSGLTIDATSLASVINEVWRPKVERPFYASLLAGDFFVNSSDSLNAMGGDTLNIPDLFTNSFTANDKSVDDSSSPEVTLQDVAAVTIQLVVNTWKEVSYLINDKERAQALKASDYLAAYAEKALYQVSRAMDTSLMALQSGLSTSSNDTASDVSDPRVREAVENVVDSDVPYDELAFFFHPTVVWHDLFGISAYQAAFDYQETATGGLGNMSPVRQRAYRGRLYGIPVFETTQVQADTANSAFYNLIAHPRAFTYGITMPDGNYTPRSQANYYFEALGTLWTTDLIYGVKEVRDECASVIKSRQSGIVS